MKLNVVSVFILFIRFDFFKMVCKVLNDYKTFDFMKWSDAESSRVFLNLTQLY